MFEIDISEEFGSSDYAIIQFQLSTAFTHNRKTAMKRDIRRIDWECFRDILSRSNDWSKKLLLKYVDLARNYFV